MKSEKLDSKKIQELYDKGKTDAEIAKAVGVKAENIQKWRRERHLVSSEIMKRTDLTPLVKTSLLASDMGMSYGAFVSMGYRPEEAPRRRRRWF